MLEDPKGEWTIQQVSQPALANQFHTNETQEKGINYQINTYCLRFRIYNSLNTPLTLYLLNKFGTGEEPLEYFTLYHQNASGLWVEQESGQLVPWSKRQGTKAIPAIPIHISAGQELTLYLRLHSSFLVVRPDYLNITFTSELSFYKTAYENEIESIGLAQSFISILFVGVFLCTIFLI